ncbi:hypothetical protein [Azospirillum largimobile]
MVKNLAKQHITIRRILASIKYVHMPNLIDHAIRNDFEKYT